MSSIQGADSRGGKCRLPNEDYTVGWICALNTEYVAAKVFLDHEHLPPTEVPAYDNIDYTFGQISKLNVVIAVWTGGEYDLMSAAEPARRMLHTFPNIRVALSVGIGGGAPNSEHDIRLGDVVVGVPQDGLGGFLKFPLLNDIRNQPFRSIAFPGEPPQFLLTAIRMLRADHELNGHQIQEDIEAKLAMNASLRKKYDRPDTETDQLYQSHIVRRMEEPFSSSYEQSLVVRQSRDEHDGDPAIHYGLVASMNEPIKDTRLRDRLAKRGAVCFDVGVAWLMDRFPCLAIRGICDYADTHKTKEWQGYAAMSAAAYAKNLLKMIPPDKVESEEPLSELVAGHLDKVMQWLSAPDPSTQLYRARELYQPGTNQWLLNSEVYLSWKTGQTSFLFVHGMPGCGKTILSSTVINDLQENITLSQTMLYFYFDYANMEKQSTEKAVRSLLSQLYRKSAVSQEVLDSLYTSYAESGGQPTLETLQTALQSMILQCKEVWIIVDGLDECETQSKDGIDGIIPWIKSLKDLSINVHLFVTSRPEVDIISSISAWASPREMLSLNADLLADDIEVYILERVERIKRGKIKPDIWKEISREVNDHANGMFLWAVHQLDELEMCLSAAEVRSALRALPQSLHEAYTRLFRRTLPACSPQAIRLLQILVYSVRPVLLGEAFDALEKEQASTSRFDPAIRLSIEERLAQYCPTLVCLTKTKHDTMGHHMTQISFVHFSIREYLRENASEPSIAAYFDKGRLAQDGPDQLVPELALADLIADLYSQIPTDNEDIQSDVSDISHVSSVFTQATDSTGFSGASIQIRDPLQMAAQTLAYSLYHDLVIHDLYLDAVQQFGRVRFSLNHDRLLKVFWKDVLRVTTEPKLEQVVRPLAKRQARNLVTTYILQMFQIELDNSLGDRASIQTFVDQQEDRNYSLNRFLLSHQPVDVAADTDGLEDSENNEETDDEGDISGSKTGAFNEVKQVLDYITGGAPYQTFKSNLACFTHPPTSIAEALSLRNSRALRSLLRKQFDSVAQGEYAWLQDLEVLGYTRDEIAEILLEEASDSPWIFFTPPPEPDPINGTQTGSHIRGCVHQMKWNFGNHNKDFHTPTLVSDSRESDFKESTSLLDVQRLCGLGGITPSSRNIEEWNGSVTFEEDNTAALITYEHSDIWKVVHRLEVTLGLFCTAIKHCQSQQLCCDSFTIIKLPQALSNRRDLDTPLVEVCRINFRVAFQLLSEVKALLATQDIDTHKLPAATILLEEIFQTKQTTGLTAEATCQTAVHECSLAIQMMCLGFLSYLQGHVGPIHPVFLDTPIKRAKLFGCHKIQREQNFSGIEVELIQLRCVGEMLQGPVLVFKHADESLSGWPLYCPSPLKFDLFTSAEDLVDTWGPAQFIVTDLNDSFPSVIKIGGGIILASDATGTEFHWSKDGPSTHPCLGNLDPTKKIRIGSPVSVNTNCLLDESLCRDHSEAIGLLRYLGTYTPGWERTEKQIGIQTGQYVVLQANAAYHKHPGRTLKQYRLEQEDQELVSFLEDCWAVQVSLCTNIARRVPLRQMVAEVLPVFANTLTSSDDFSNWESLQADYDIFAAFHGTTLQHWLRSLPAAHYSLILRIIRNILNVLSETGLDRNGKSFLVSWPYGNDVYQCLEINLSQQESSWARIIADSDYCATFAYASPHCLETEKYRCRRVKACCWRNTVPLLETAVTICVSQELMVRPPPATSKLVHEDMYYFKTFGSVHVVKAEQPDPMAVAKLVTKQSSIADKMMHRLYARTQLAKHLRERSRTQGNTGTLAWLTSSV